MNVKTTPFLIKTLIVLCCVVLNTQLGAQSLQHPHIWAYAEDRQEILDNINQYDWAESLFDQLIGRVDSHKDAHIANPATFLSAIPAIPGEYSTRTAHTNQLTIASEAAILYFLTEEEEYAHLAADVLAHYNKYLSLNDSVKSNNGTGIFFNDWWLESRALFPKIAVIYDFVYEFVNDPNSTVYDLSTNSRKAFDNDEAQYTVTMLSVKVIKSISAPHSNHSILANNGSLFNLMMIDDDVDRESLFQRYYYDVLNERKDAFTWTLANFTAQDIWDETIGYNEGTHEFVIEAMEVIDRFKPELNVISDNLRVWDGYAFYEQYFYPNGEILRYGDTGYELTLTEGYEWMLQSAKRKNLTEYITLAKQALKYRHNEMVGGYDPKIVTDRLGWYSPLQLLWGNHIADTVTPEVEEPRMSQAIEHAGLIMQRNYSTANVEEYGMMYYSGGASYVHTHSTGIDLELYGNGLVMGAESGSGSYGSDEHENYRVRLAAHNTVIANGSGRRGTNWDTKMDDVELIACEPLSNKEPISNKFSFSTQYINDTYNNCIQQRTTSIIRINSFWSYYFDIFRSKGKTTNNYHDYIYHNIGDEVSLRFNDPESIEMSASDRYANEVNGVTGWTFFEDVESSASTEKAVKAVFRLNEVNKQMNVYFPGGISHEYSTAKAPTTKGAREGYSSKKTPVVSLRKQGEAWDKPFVAVYDPHVGGADQGISSVQNIEVDGSVVGAIVVSQAWGMPYCIDYILAFDEEKTIEIPELYMTFTGRFAVIRKENQTEDTQTITMYIGEGESLTYGDINLQAGDDKKATKEYYGVPKLNDDSRFTLTTRVVGGGGTISVDPEKAEYVAGEKAVVTVHPEEGYVLDEWLGDASGNDDTDTLVFFSDKSANARFRFAEYYYLNTSAENGKISQSVVGNEHQERTSIELTATPDDRYEFVGWTGAVESTDNPLTIRMDSTIDMVANFRELELYKLDIKINGNGTVYIAPEQDEYLAGTQVTIFAQGNDADVFKNWIGDMESDFSTLYVTMDSAINLTANFSGTSAIDGLSASEIKIGPNPTFGVLNISASHTFHMEYLIYDIQGRTVQSGQFYNKKQLYIENKGLYFLQLITKWGSQVYGVVVE